MLHSGAVSSEQPSSDGSELTLNDMGRMSTAEITDWDKQIQRAARSVAGHWPGVVVIEDLVQDINLRLLETPASVAVLAGMAEGVRYRALKEMGHQIASQGRADFERFSGSFRYSVEEVRDLLESASDHGASSVGSSWGSGDFTRSGSGHSDPTAIAAAGNAKLSDARKQLGDALDSLRRTNVGQYDALVSRFVEGVIPADKASLMVITRAITSLTTKMNHGHKQRHAGELVPGKSLGDGPGSRRAISRSTARYISKEGWDADYMPAPSHLRDNHIEAEVWDR